jgi:hypothetical protein
MDWTLLGIILAFLGGTGVSTIIVKIIDVKSKKKDCRDATQIARDTILVCLSAESLIRLMQECLHKGYMDIHQRRFCEKLYGAYKALGGNDIVDSLYEQCKELSLECK